MIGELLDGQMGIKCPAIGATHGQIVGPAALTVSTGQDNLMKGGIISGKANL
jgi:hypothetical protein